MSASRHELRQRIAEAARPTLLDRAIRYIDPVRGAARLRARMMMAVAGGYTGASRSKRSLSQWSTGLGNADVALNADLALLRERSTDLMRNAPLARGAVNTVVTNAVGTGLSLQSHIDAAFLGLTEEAASAWQANTEREFRLWAESTDCDLTRTCNLYGLQELAFRAVLVDGDVGAMLPHQPLRGAAYGLRVQLVAGARIANPGGKADSPTLVAGVEFDDSGAPVAYHVLRSHPGAIYTAKGARETDRYAAFGERTGRRSFLHLYRPLWPGQTRGEPYLAPVIDTLKQLDRYAEAEIMAAVVSSMFTVFTTTESGGGFTPAEQASGIGPEVGTRGDDKDIKLGSGAIIDLVNGEKVEFADPSRPNTAFDGFVLAVMRQVGVALEIPFELLVKHFTASYSAARAALLEAWRFFRGRRAWLAGAFCQPIYETWLAEAVSAGRISAPGFFRDPAVRAAYCRATWAGDGPGAIDPTKEVQAASDRVEMGLTTLAEEVVAYDGGDWEEKHRQRAKEVRMRREDRLTSAAPAVGNTQPGQPGRPPLANPEQPDNGAAPDDSGGPLDRPDQPDTGAR